MKNVCFLFFSIFFLSLKGAENTNFENFLLSDEQFEQRLNALKTFDHVGPKINLPTASFEKLRELSSVLRAKKQGQTSTPNNPGSSTDIKKILKELQKPVALCNFELLGSTYGLENPEVTVLIDLKSKQIAQKTDPVAGFCITRKSNSSHMANIPTSQFDDWFSIIKKRTHFYAIFTGDPKHMYPITGVTIQGTVNGKSIKEACQMSDVNPLVTVAKSLAATPQQPTLLRNSDDDIADNLLVLFESSTIVNEFKCNPTNTVLTNIIKRNFPTATMEARKKALDQILYCKIIEDTN